MMTQASAAALAAWLLKNQPGVFATMLKHHEKLTNAPKTLKGLGDDFTVDTSSFINPDVTQDLVNTTAALNIDTSFANADTSSVLSSLGSSVGTAVSNVASFLLKGTALIAPVAVAALTAQASTQNKNAQLAVLSAQTARANAGMAPSNIAYTSSGQPVYIPTSAPGTLTTLPAGLGAQIMLPTGQTGYALTPQALANLQPSFLQKYGIWIAGGGALLALALFLS